MRIEFVKRHTLNGNKMVLGTKVDVWGPTAEGLIKEGIAKKYSGPWPPTKTKTEFFKPK